MKVYLILELNHKQVLKKEKIFLMLILGRVSVSRAPQGYYCVEMGPCMVTASQNLYEYSLFNGTVILVTKFVPISLYQKSFQGI